jgi:GntR family transcriptional regulator, rspAB operon transcriptional repressor
MSGNDTLRTKVRAMPRRIGPVQRTPLFELRPHETTYRLIKRRIVFNEYPPGHVLGDILTARELQLSQGTVREALLRIQLDGLGLRSVGRRTIVTGLAKGEIEEIIALRKRIQVEAARAIVANATPDAELSLANAVRDMGSAASLGDEFHVLELECAFQVGLYAVGGFTTLEQSLSRLILHSQRTRLWAPGRSRTALDVANRNMALFAPFKARDAAALADALAAHVDTIVLPK